MFMKHYAPNRCEPSIEALNFRGRGDQGRCGRRSEVFVKIIIIIIFLSFFLFFFGGGGGEGGRCGRRSEVFVKIIIIIIFLFFLGGGGGGVGVIVDVNREVKFL